MHIFCISTLFGLYGWFFGDSFFDKNLHVFILAFDYMLTLLCLFKCKKFITIFECSWFCLWTSCSQNATFGHWRFKFMWDKSQIWAIVWQQQYGKNWYHLQWFTAINQNTSNNIHKGLDVSIALFNDLVAILKLCMP